MSEPWPNYPAPGPAGYPQYQPAAPVVPGMAVPQAAPPMPSGQPGPALASPAAYYPGYPGAVPALVAAPPGAPAGYVSPVSQSSQQFQQLRRRAGGAAGTGLPAPFGPARPASAGLRFGAVTLDLVALAGLFAIGFYLSSIALGIALALDLAVVDLIWQARTGLTPGNFVAGLRTTRAATPSAPGGARVLARWGITLLSCVIGIGPWLLAVSGLWDSRHERRALVDRATGTRVMTGRRVGAVPVERAVGPAGQASAPAGAFRSPTVTEPGGGGSRADFSAAPVATGLEAGLSRWGATGEPPATPGDVAHVRGPAQAAVPASDTAPQLPGQGTDDYAPTRAKPLAAPAQPGAITLIFDTGQRVRLTGPGIAVVGRAPVPAAGEASQLVRVQDPDKTVSKNHARLELAQNELKVTDLGSTNGTAIVRADGTERLLPAGETVTVPHGVTVRLGDRTFVAQAQRGSQG